VGIESKKVVKWTDPQVVGILQQVVRGELTAASAAEKIGTRPHYVRVRADWLAKYGAPVEPEHRKKRAKAAGGTAAVKIVIPAVSPVDWSKFLGSSEQWDLRRVAAMFYAAERIIREPHLPPNLWGIRRRSEEFVRTWAERFGKYLLAACIGEFRHRRRVGALRLPISSSVKMRAAAQGVAQAIWEDRETVRAVASYMAEKFADPAFFPKTAYGGPRWARIARTFLDWHEGRISDLVFVDYCWDLQHNGGILFNKCPLFTYESSVRHLMAKKALSRSVMDWGGEFLHPEWRTALDVLEFPLREE
jgi:hypothetical protein